MVLISLVELILRDAMQKSNMKYNERFYNCKMRESILIDGQHDIDMGILASIYMKRN